MDDASFAHMGYCSGFFSVVFRMQLKKEESANVSDAGSRGARETEGRHPDEGSLPSFRCGLSPTGLRFVFSRHTRVSPGLLLLAHPRASVPQNERRTFTIVRLRSAPGPVEYEMSRQTATRGLSVRYMWNMSRENDLERGDR